MPDAILAFVVLVTGLAGLEVEPDADPVYVAGTVAAILVADSEGTDLTGWQVVIHAGIGVAGEPGIGRIAGWVDVPHRTVHHWVSRRPYHWGRHEFTHVRDALDDGLVNGSPCFPDLLGVREALLPYPERPSEICANHWWTAAAAG